MAEVALAWHYSKGVAAPIVGGSKVSHLEDALRAVELRLKPEDVRYLEEPYRPHEVVGALPAPE
jgi:aryl-alcohol dehydrogenase-like predicted oxidoreductase